MFKEKVNGRTDGRTTDNRLWHKLAGLWPVELKKLQIFASSYWFWHVSMKIHCLSSLWMIKKQFEDSLIGRCQNDLCCKSWVFIFLYFLICHLKFYFWLEFELLWCQYTIKILFKFYFNVQLDLNCFNIEKTKRIWIIPWKFFMYHMKWKYSTSFYIHWGSVKNEQVKQSISFGFG